jgi:phage terminase large subunit-like protein
MAPINHAAAVHQYARDVLDGTVIAGNWIRLAAKRHLDDLAKSEDPDYPYRFSAKKAQKICAFASLIPHVKGSFARRRERIKLENWQRFCLGNIFGWLRKSDGLRRFRTAMLYVPRKNGKSLLASVIGLYMLAMDGEAGAEVLCGATSLDQANFVFRPAQQIVEKTVGLRQLGIQVLANALVVPSTGSRMLSIIGQPPDGSNPSCGIVDEVHEHVNDLLIITLVTGMGSRDAPLLLALTTAGGEWGDMIPIPQNQPEHRLGGGMWPLVKQKSVRPCAVAGFGEKVMLGSCQKSNRGYRSQ